MAAGIAIGNPPRLTQMLHAIQETQGRILSVSEQEIQNAAQQLSQQGWYTEYTSAVGLAAWTSAGMPPNVLIPLTGSGLKNP
jgi:threonine synthase